MAKMVSLKLSKKEAKSEIGYPEQVGKDENLPKYPWDTKITLGNEVLDKLGVKPSDFKTNQVLEITAKVEVVGTTEEQRQRGPDRSEVRLQITDLAIDTKAMKKARAEDEHLNSIAGPTSETVDED
ncbi:capsid staple protein [uncultured Devosia sp.]|uniref:capsid staple protein n=1 Tax=uncultured Devosia sp. TaxID=211434 RepID=UPI0026131347|nr:hypothetical protein [uncultured Devosia sp.]